MPTLLIFDCDGTLVDSERLYNRAWSEVLHRHGLTWTPEDCARRLMGRALPDCLSILAGELKRDVAEHVHAEVADESAKLFQAEGLVAVRGIAEALAVLPHSKCVASSGRLEEVTANLIETGLLHYFGPSRVFVTSMVKKGKPAPDLFLHAAEMLGFSASDCIVVEDSVPGVMGGKAAGMHVLGFAGGYNDPVALEAAGAAVFHDMRLLPNLVGKAVLRSTSATHS